jgi:hypothetical protein
MTAAKKAQGKRAKLRDQIWPGAENEIFSPNTGSGFSRVPRVVPLVSRLINNLGGKINAGPLYQTLWAQDWGQGIIEIRSFRGLLYESGYSDNKSRAERTWRERIAVLIKWGFVKTGKNGLDEHGFVLLVNPYLAVVRLEAKSEKFDRTVIPIWQEWFPQFQILCTNWGVDLDAYRARAKEQS